MGILQGKVAIVTGASKGIGAEISRTLAEAGAAVAVNYASSKEGADRVVADITAKGGKAIAIKGDVAKAADVEHIFAEAKKAFGSLDILVNNAGVYAFQPLDALTEDEFHRLFNTNVLGTILAAREALKNFGPNGGSIINVSSVASTSSMPTTVSYSATKGAIDAVTRVLAAELGPKKIRVNGIAPGPVETEGVHTLGLIGTDLEKQMVAGTPLGRIGQPDDVAKVVLFLASDNSGWVSGETIRVAGGYH
ncbi:glucose 1-dehydrogenase [Hyphomicrobium sp. B1]|uniref:SDR family NAD(P)-dependent oxidoreductase n=1 Tax=Hyphomicrobium sp. B1 TaxID=3075651 RepID=UPI003C2F8B08